MSWAPINLNQISHYECFCQSLFWCWSISINIAHEPEVLGAERCDGSGNLIWENHTHSIPPYLQPHAVHRSRREHFSDLTRLAIDVDMILIYGQFLAKKRGLDNLCKCKSIGVRKTYPTHNIYQTNVISMDASPFNFCPLYSKSFLLCFRDLLGLFDLGLTMTKILNRLKFNQDFFKNSFNN